MNKTDIDKLKDQVIKQATFLIKEYGEFYPFGFVIDAENKLKPTDVYFGEEYPSILDVIENLETAYKEGIAKQNYNVVSICVDVRVTPPTMNEKKDALELRINTKEKESVNFYIPYELFPDGSLKFYNSYSLEGTLNLF